jgi:hypothetical protein
LAALVLAEIEAQRPRGPRKLRRSQLRWSAEHADAKLARELGVLALVDAARDAHLARLGADDGLAALCVPWEDVVSEAVGLLDRPLPRNCPRCGARLPKRRAVCGRCRSPVPRT